MVSSVRADEKGFTLTEMLCALTVAGVLVTIAVPAFVAFKARGFEAAAKADVRAAVPAVEAYFAECGTYASATASQCGDSVDHTFDVAGLEQYDAALQLATVKSLGGGSGYCIDSTVGGKAVSLVGPGGTIASGACA
jgi:prepilin-type N-terminal cleavage/methylation domain-containing protein